MSQAGDDTAQTGGQAEEQNIHSEDVDGIQLGEMSAVPAQPPIADAAMNPPSTGNQDASASQSIRHIDDDRKEDGQLCRQQDRRAIAPQVNNSASPAADVLSDPRVTSSAGTSPFDPQAIEKLIAEVTLRAVREVTTKIMERGQGLNVAAPTETAMASGDTSSATHGDGVVASKAPGKGGSGGAVTRQTTPGTSLRTSDSTSIGEMDEGSQESSQAPAANAGLQSQPRQNLPQTLPKPVPLIDSSVSMFSALSHPEGDPSGMQKLAIVRDAFLSTLHLRPSSDWKLFSPPGTQWRVRVWPQGFDRQRIDPPAPPVELKAFTIPNNSESIQGYSKEQLKYAIEDMWPKGFNDFETTVSTLPDLPRQQYRGILSREVVRKNILNGNVIDRVMLFTLAGHLDQYPFTEDRRTQQGGCTQRQDDQNIYHRNCEILWRQWCKGERTSAVGFTSRTGQGQIIYVTSHSRRGVLEVDLPQLSLGFVTRSPSSYRSIDLRPVSKFVNPRSQHGGRFLNTGFCLRDILQWQIRYFKPVKRSWSTARWIKDGHVDLTFDPIIDQWRVGIVLERQVASIGNPKRPTRFQEHVASVSLSDRDQYAGLFTIIVLTDEHCGEVDASAHTIKSIWEKYNIRPCAVQKSLGFRQWLVEILRVYDMSIISLERTLNSIDKLVQVSLNDFADVNRIDDLMFDPSFSRSKDYFSALQILRLVDEGVMEGPQKLGQILHTYQPYALYQYDPEAGQLLEQAIGLMKDKAAIITTRVKTKKAEIVSLRDGLFNATSLREASKAMSLNQAIYIFTIITVLFTPISFLATFWALPFLNDPVKSKDDSESETVGVPGGFQSTMITIPLLTYAMVIFISRKLLWSWVEDTQQSLVWLFSQLRRHGSQCKYMLGDSWEASRDAVVGLFTRLRRKVKRRILPGSTSDTSSSSSWAS